MHGRGGLAGLQEPWSRCEGHVGKNVPDENTETWEEDHSDHVGWLLELRDVRTRTRARDEMSPCTLGTTRASVSVSVTLSFHCPIYKMG